MHKSVLLNECIKYLNLKDDSIIVDCTLGYGGHSSNILKKIPNGHLYSFDQDIDTEHYTGIKLFSIWCGLLLLALGFWAVIGNILLLGLFSIKDFVEYLINII